MGRKRSFATVRVEEQARIAAYIERYALRLRQGSTVGIAGAVVDPDFSVHHAVLLDALASSIRAGIGIPEATWPPQAPVQ